MVRASDPCHFCSSKKIHICRSIDRVDKLFQILFKTIWRLHGLVGHKVVSKIDHTIPLNIVPKIELKIIPEISLKIVPEIVLCKAAAIIVNDKITVLWIYLQLRAD